jgi:tetratricopeptide (TPR) repeat protein
MLHAGSALVAQAVEDGWPPGDALAELEQAARLAPENAHYAYVLRVALHSTGQTPRALEVLRAAHERHPADRDLLVALTTISRDIGKQQAAQEYAAALVAVAPWDPDARRLQQEMSNP